ncbi:MAG: acyl-CoA dehydrogenase family protein [Deltaproteobacteria bacterium]|nr:acyl-CoA dehydrogenase family protein [Deltaproteobacteria bacterium]
MFDFTPTEEQEALKTMVREFVDREVKPKAPAYDAEPDPIKGIPWDIIKSANELGLKDIAVRKELGGGGADSQTLGMLVEELAVGDLGTSVIYAQNWKVIQILQHAGTEEQMKNYLVPLLEDPVGCCAVALKEPESGSDHFIPIKDPKAGPKMSCVKDGDHVILNGTKEFISNGYIAHLYIIFARSDPKASLTEGMSAFIVPRDLPGVDNFEGFRVGRVYDKIGERLAGNAELIFEDCRVPVANMVAGWNTALRDWVQISPQSNAYAGASTLGVGWAAFDRALEYSQMRIQGVKPIIKHANISIKLADMYASLVSAQMMVRRGCWQADHPEYFDLRLARSIKPFCSKVVIKVALEAMQMFGGNGAMRDVGMEKLVRDATIFLHSDGTNDALDRGTGELLAGSPIIR